MPGMYIYNSGELRKCERCGAPRRVISSDSWGYWYGVHFCCSYHCMRAMEAADTTRERVRAEIDGIPLPSKPKKARPPRARYLRIGDEDLERLLQMRREGKCYREIGQALGRATSTVGTYCRRHNL